MSGAGCLYSAARRALRQQVSVYGRLVPLTGIFHDLIDRIDLIHPGIEAINFGLRPHSSFAHAVFTEQASFPN